MIPYDLVLIHLYPQSSFDGSMVYDVLLRVANSGFYYFEETSNLTEAYKLAQRYSNSYNIPLEISEWLF